MKIFNKKKGFTLIELLIVIGIIAILMAIAIVAINPARQFAKANNARRWGDVSAIADAISIRVIDEKGGWTIAAGCEALPTDGAIKSLAADPAPDDPTVVDLCGCLIDEYLGAIPLDPTTSTAPTTPPCTGYDTGYEITGTTAGRIKISAPTIDDEGTGTPPEISVTR